MTIEVTTGHCLGGEGNDVYPGMVLVAPGDITLEQAEQMLRRGFARLVIPKPVITYADPMPETRDPELAPRPTRPRKGKK